MLAGHRLFVVACVAGLLATLTACGSSSTTPSPRLDLTGTWSGTLGQPGSGSALRLTWVATHTGNIAAGVATLVKPADNVPGRGAMTGVLDGDRLLLTYAIPPDSIQGFPRCEIAGIGNATAASASLSGTLTLTFRNCSGSGLEAPSTNDLRLTK